MNKKEEFIKLYEESGGVNAPKGTLKKMAQELDVPEGTTRRWKHEHIKKNKQNVHKKKSERTEKAKKKKYTDNEKKDVVKKYLDGMDRKEIEEETGMHLATIDRLIQKYSLYAMKSIDTNIIIEEARGIITEDKREEAKEILSWQRTQLEKIQKELESEEANHKDIFFKLKNISEITKQKFQIIGIKYDKSLAEMVKVVSDIRTEEETDKKLKFNIEEVWTNEQDN